MKFKKQNRRGEAKLMSSGNKSTRLSNPLTTLILALLSTALMGQGTAGTVDISIKTIDYGKDRAPKHVLAIWIENDAGAFIKTLKLRAEARKQYLYTWNSKSSGNTTDAITGATLGSHTTHEVSWNCTNTSSTVVADGSYKVWIEYTSEHAQGPITSFAFTKAADDFSFQPPDQSYFVDMDLVYTPQVISGIDKPTISYNLSAYPNPAREQVSIKMSNPIERHTSIKIYQADMRLINVLYDDHLSAGKHEFTWNLNSMSGAKVSAGTYFMVVSSDNMLSTRQIVVQ
jgi:flagellar hook assembly protein FlgD